MKLHGFPFSPNTRRVLFMLHEVHAEHEFIPVDLTQGEHRSPEYLKLNPNGRVPCLVDQDFILWESNAILQYLAARFPEHHLGGERPRERAEIACWLFLNSAHLGPAFAHIFAHTMRLPEEKRIPAMVENARAELVRNFTVLDGKLAESPWLAGSTFTIADISIAATTSIAPMLGVDLSPYPHLAAWDQRVAQRPAYKKTFGLPDWAPIRPGADHPIEPRRAPGSGSAIPGPQTGYPRPVRPLYSLLLLAGCSTPIRPSQDSTAPHPPPSAEATSTAEPGPSASAPTIPGAQRFSPREVPDEPGPLMAPFALNSQKPARRTLFSWTTTEQAETMRTGKKLLFRGASDVTVDALFETHIRNPSGTRLQRRVQLMVSKPPLDKHRFAFTNPIGWSVGVSGKPYGSVLVRVTLREEAVLLSLGLGGIQALRSDGGVVADEILEKHPERVAAVFHEGMDLRGIVFREYVLVNEGMIESWELGTEEVRQDVERARLAVERLIPVSPEANQVDGSEMRLFWYGERSDFPEAPWSGVLGVGSPTYAWTRKNLEAIVAQLKAAEHPVALTHHPRLTGPVRLPILPPEPPPQPRRTVIID